MPKIHCSGLEGHRVLMIGMYYAPETTGSAPYASDTAEELAQLGADVHVVTTHPHYPAWHRLDGSRNKAVNEMRNGVHVYRRPCYVPSRPTPMKRLIYELSFSAAATTALAALPADLIIGTSPNLFSAVLAAGLARQRRRPLLQLVQDVVSRAGAQTGQVNSKTANTLLGKLEGAALRKAWSVTVPTDGLRSALRELGVDNRRIVTVPNWSRLTPHRVDRSTTRKALGWHDDELVVLHSGNIGAKQGLHEFLPVMRQLASSEPLLRFVFMGKGNQLEALVRGAKELPTVEILEPVNDEDYYSMLMAADVLLVHERSTVRDICLPSKLTSYFAAGRPILAVVHPEGATAEEIRKSKAGQIISRTGSVEELKTAIFGLAEPSKAATLGAAGIAYSKRYLDRRAALGTIASLAVEAICSAQEPSRSKWE